MVMFFVAFLLNINIVSLLNQQKVIMGTHMEWRVLYMSLCVILVGALERPCTFTDSAGNYYDLSPLSTCKYDHSLNFPPPFLLRPLSRGASISIFLLLCSTLFRTTLNMLTTITTC